MAYFYMHVKRRYLSKKPAFPKMLRHCGAGLHGSLDHPGLTVEQVTDLQRDSEGNIFSLRDPDCMLLSVLLAAGRQTVIGHRGAVKVGHD